jgi:hypothetical protein
LGALHFFSYGISSVDSVGVKLYPHCLGIEVIETDLNLKYVLPATGLNLHFAKV